MCVVDRSPRHGHNVFVTFLVQVRWREDCVFSRSVFVCRLGRSQVWEAFRQHIGVSTKTSTTFCTTDPRWVARVRATEVTFVPTQVADNPVLIRVATTSYHYASKSGQVANNLCGFGKVVPKVPMCSISSLSGSDAVIVVQFQAQTAVGQVHFVQLQQQQPTIVRLYR